MVKVVEPMKVCKLFGAYATVAGIENALPLFHSPCGCQYYIRASMLLHDGIDPVILTSDLTQQDVIFGGEDRLRKSIIACQKVYDPDLIMVLSSCAPSLVGDDIRAVANEIGEEVRADVLAVDSAGFMGDQASGFKDTILELLSFYALDDLDVEESAVNLIGIIPGYDYRWRNDVLSLTDTLASAGLEVNAVLGGFSSLDQIRSVGKAALNIVLSDIRGLEIASYLNQRFGTPFVLPRYLPIGMQSTRDWLTSISQHISGLDWNAIDKRLEDAIKTFEYADLALITTYTVDATAAIVAEPYRAMSLARFLTEDIGIKVITISVNESNQDTEAYIIDGLGEIGQENCTVLLDPDGFTLRKTLNELKPSLIYGSSFEGVVAREVGASLIKISYPTYDEYLLTERPYMGFNGIPVVMEDLVNGIIRREF